MEPTYADGDWLLVEHVVGSSPVRLGEVVVARRGERLVTHRVVRLQGEFAVTKGDACAHADPPVAIRALLGRVIGVRRKPGLLPRLRRVVRSMRRFVEAPSGGSHE